MPKYLSSEEISRLAEYLTMYASLPFGHDLPGEIVEELVARARGATYVGKRANRPEPDMVLDDLNYQIKTEKCPDNRVNALSQRGKIEDIITARVDVLSDYGGLPDDPDSLGRLVLRSYSLPDTFSNNAAFITNDTNQRIPRMLFFKYRRLSSEPISHLPWVRFQPKFAPFAHSCDS